MSKSWPTMPPNCMGVSVFGNHDYPDARAYCTQKGCLGCCIKTRIIIDAMTGEPHLKALGERMLADIRAQCWKGSVVCYPEECLKTLPAPVLKCINDPPIEMLRYLNGEEGHRHDAISIIMDYAGYEEFDRENLDDWCQALTVRWYRELNKV